MELSLLKKNIAEEESPTENKELTVEGRPDIPGLKKESSA